MIAVSLAVLFAVLFGNSVAAAATQVGIKFGGPGSEGFPGTMLQTQTEVGVNDYEVPSAGVITSWSSYKGTQAQQLKLKVGRFVAKNDYSMVAESALETLTVAGTNVFPTRIAVAAGDVIGLYSATANVGTVEGKAGFDFEMFRQLTVDIAPGGPDSMEGPLINRAINVAAYVEPDADADGYGDETQDKCPGSAGTVNGCVPAPPASTPTQTVTSPTINTDPVRPVAKCPKGKKKVKVKGVSKCVKLKKHKGKGKAKAKGHK